MISTLCLTSNLPFITSQSLIGKDVKLHAFLTAGAGPGTAETGGLQDLSTGAGLGLVGLCVARLVRLERDSAEPSDAEYLGLAVILLSYLLSTLLLVFSLRY